LEEAFKAIASKLYTVEYVPAERRRNASKL